MISMMPPTMDIPNEQLEMMKAMIGMSVEVVESLGISSGMNALNGDQVGEHQQMVGMLNMRPQQHQQFGYQNQQQMGGPMMNRRPPIGAPTGPSAIQPPAGPGVGRGRVGPGPGQGPGLVNQNRPNPGLPMRPGGMASPVNAKKDGEGESTTASETENAKGDESLRE